MVEILNTAHSSLVRFMHGNRKLTIIVIVYQNSTSDGVLDTSQWLAWCSILSTLYITPRNDDVLIDVAIWSNCIRSVAVLSHITITDDKFPLSTSDVVHFNTVCNVWFNVCQVQGKWRIPKKSRKVSNKCSF